MTEIMRDEIRFSLIKAAEAMRLKNKADAFFWASKAARLAPNLEDPWLIMAAISNPQASLEYLNQALVINPDSQRAKKGVIWATKRLQTLNIPPQSSLKRIENTQPIRVHALPPPSVLSPHPQPKRINLALFWIGLMAVICIGSLGLSAYASNYFIPNQAQSAPLAQHVLDKERAEPARTALEKYLVLLQHGLDAARRRA